eukprot:53467-Pelagomonas_calceolata.AAC.2
MFTYRFLLCKHGRGAKQKVNFVITDQGLDQRVVLFALTIIIVPASSSLHSTLIQCNSAVVVCNR